MGLLLLRRSGRSLPIPVLMKLPVSVRRSSLGEASASAIGVFTDGWR
jgi:hypothetical protein